MKKQLGIFLLSLATLTACSYTDDTTTTENSTENTQMQSEESSKENHQKTPVEGLMLVGQKMDVDYIKHIEYDHYEIGMYDKNGVLMWFQLYGGEYNRITIKKKEGIQKAYIERLENVPKREGAKYLMPNYIIYVPENQKVAAGTIKRVYKSSTDYIRTTMIYSNS